MNDRYLSGKRRPAVPQLSRPAVGKPYHPPVGATAAVMVDIDGTVALHGDRDPYDTSRYLEDQPNPAVVEAVRMEAAAGRCVLFCSGRSRAFEGSTMEWLGEHVVTDGMVWDLFMRPAGDMRPDDVVKLELFDEHIRDRFDVRRVYDDRAKVVAAWRAIGLTVLQVAPGDF